MTPDGTNLRRRSLLWAVAAGITAPETPVLRTDGHGTTPSVGSSDSSGVEFLVSQRDGRVVVERHGTDAPVFAGAAGAAIQYAIDAGRDAGHGTGIAVAPGTYELERPVTLAASTQVVGSGPATTLKAMAGLDADLVTIPPTADHAEVSTLRLHGNRAANDRGSALVVLGGAWRPVIERVVVREAAAHGVQFTSGPDGQYTYEPVCSDIDVARCRRDGFVFGYTGDLFGTDLYAEACGDHGFTMADAGGVVVHPHAYDTRGPAGMRVLPSARDLLLYGLHAERNRQHGLVVEGTRVTVRDAFVADNGRDAPGARDGLVLESATDCTVAGSAFLNAAEDDPTQRYGIAETAASPGTVVRHNLFRANRAGAVDRRDPQRGDTLRCLRNRGYRTEHGGETTVADGETIVHGLAARPTEYRISAVEPGTYAHATAADETTLTAEVLRLAGDAAGAPVADPVPVVWSARIR